MQPDRHGDYLLFHLDWDRGTIIPAQASPPFRQYVPVKEFPLSPIMHAFGSLGADTPAGVCQKFLIDVRYDKQNLYLRLHRTEDFASVVDVPRERLRALMTRLLTPRETQIAILLFEGRTIRYIASMLYIAEGTVKRTIYNIYRKLDVGSQVELVREIYTQLAQFDWSPVDNE